MARKGENPMQEAATLCGAKTRSGEPCKQAPMPNGRCRMHGGKSLRGMESPNLKHGRYSRYAPAGKLGERYTRHLADLDYLSLSHEMALITARIEELVGAGMEDPKDRNEIRKLVEARRKLAETEAKRIKLANDTLTGEQRAAWGRLVLEAVRRHVTDGRTLQAIQDEVVALVHQRIEDAA
jgi:hypothetical protein